MRAGEMEKITDSYKDRAREQAVDDAGSAEDEINVLLIEDNPGDARLVKETLKEARDVVFNLIWVNRLTSGLKILAKGKTEVILSDLFLPDSRGMETIRVLKKHAPHTPIIAMTGYVDEDGSQAVEEAGAKDYIVKQGYHYKGVSRKDGGPDKSVEDAYVGNSNDDHLLVDAIMRVIGERGRSRVTVKTASISESLLAEREKELHTSAEVGKETV